MSLNLEVRSLALRATVIPIRLYCIIITHLLLSLSHGQELESVPAVPHSLSQLAQVSSRICTGTEDEHNWGVGSGLVVNALKADDRRGHILLPHSPCDKVGDGSVDAIDSEATEQHELLEVRETLAVTAREGRGLRSIEVKPLETGEEIQVK